MGLIRGQRSEVPHATRQVSPHTTTPEPACSRVLTPQEKPKQHNQRKPVPASKTQGSQRERGARAEKPEDAEASWKWAPAGCRDKEGRHGPQGTSDGARPWWSTSRTGTTEAGLPSTGAQRDCSGQWLSDIQAGAQMCNPS